MNKLIDAFAGMMESVERGNTRFARIGDNESHILVTGQAGFVFVRVAGTAEVLTVFNSAIPQSQLVVGLPVEIRRDDAIGDQWYIYSGVHDTIGAASTTGANVNGDTITVINNNTTNVSAANDYSLSNQVIPAGVTLTIPVNYSWVVARQITNKGTIVNSGDIVLVG